jgi:hypothetical protein
MTNPVAPPAAPNVPIYPALGSGNFNAEAYAYGSAMPAVANTIAAIGQASFTNAACAQEASLAAAGSAITAASMATIAQGVANFKGAWPSLAGALNKPASVLHNGHFWLLLNNLANVAASEPGMSADWTRTDDSLTVSPHLTGSIYFDGSVRGPAVVLAGSVVDCSLGNYFTKTVSANTTFSFSNVPPAGQRYGVIVKLKLTAGVVSLGSNVTFTNNIAPQLATGKTHLVGAITDDGGTTWCAVVVPNFAS